METYMKHHFERKTNLFSLIILFSAAKVFIVYNEKTSIEQINLFDIIVKKQVNLKY